MANFEDNPRRKQEITKRPLADKIYHQVWGNDIKITRFEKDDNHTLDQEYAVDIEIRFPNGMILTGQEKFLSYKFVDNKSVTVEYMNDPQTGESGDWYKLQSSFYFCGYLTEEETNFEPWVIVDWARVVLASNTNKIGWIDNRNKDGHARASFRFTYMDMLPEDCILACSSSVIPYPDFESVLKKEIGYNVRIWNK